MSRIVEDEPGKGRRMKWLVAAVTALLCVGFTVGSAVGQDKDEKSRAELEAEVKALKKEVSELEAEVVELRKKVGETEKTTQKAAAKLPVVAKAEVVEQAGGKGGNWEYEVRCKDGHQPVGIWGSSGAVIDSLGLVCRKKGSEDLWRSDQVGGTGGTPYEVLCPAGQLVGLTGKAGAVIDSVSPTCSKDGQTEAAGGKGGEPYSLSCPGQTEFAGIAGRYGSVLDSVRLICE